MNIMKTNELVVRNTCMRNGFSIVAFSDEYRIILDEPNDWTRDYVLSGNSQLTQLRRQQMQKCFELVL